MTTLSEIQPRENRRLIDLLRKVGIDVSDWANCARGPKYAASNPKYCYEWSFVQPPRLVVLTLWYDEIQERDGTIFAANNMRRVAKRADAPDSFSKRADRYDLAIQVARAGNLTIRVIICDGERRGVTLPSSMASQTKRRLLDPVQWFIKTYDNDTGDYILWRASAAQLFVDQFSISPENFAMPERHTISGSAFVRSPEVRQHVLSRAGGKCELCGQAGFKTADGRIYLETHHVIPLSENGADTERNVVALCPNHHREAHHGIRQSEIRDTLLRHAAGV